MKYISLLTLAFLFTDISFGKVQIGIYSCGEKVTDKCGNSVSTSAVGSNMALGAIRNPVKASLRFNFGHMRAYRRQLNNNYRVKVLALKMNIASLDNSTKLSEKDLIRIVIPEYLSYDTKRDEFEKYLIKFFYSIKNNTYKKISFGPFQMQPQFILNNTNIKSYSEIISNIDSLSSIKTQYEILQKYVNKNSSFNLREIINLYNTGDINLELKFRKINYKMTYYDYANYIIKEFY